MSDPSRFYSHGSLVTVNPERTIVIFYEENKRKIAISQCIWRAPHKVTMNGHILQHRKQRNFANTDKVSMYLQSHTPLLFPYSVRSDGFVKDRICIPAES